MGTELKKEDYQEPCCPLKMDTAVNRIPVGRILETLDNHFAKKDFDAAISHLKYWKEEARIGGDVSGLLSVINEQIGLYRKLAMQEDGLAVIKEAMELVGPAGLNDTVTHGTTLVNAATAYNAFKQPVKALPLYREAEKIYEANLSEDDERLGGLYNNMALVLTTLESFDEAMSYYEKALKIMAKQKFGCLEEAITCLNMADLVKAVGAYENEDNVIDEYLTKAYELLNTKDVPQDGYYAFVCEKCAPVFGYYGYFLAEKDLTERARTITENL